MSSTDTEVAKVALITGAARRIGAAIVRRLHAAGYDIALHYRHSQRQAQALAASLESQRHGSMLLLAGDLSDTPANEWIRACIERFGRLDALVNNASTFHPTPVGTITETDWNDLLISNAKAPLLLCQAAAPHLRHTDGAIVNLADLYAERPPAGHVVYAMAKAALVAMTRALALDLAPQVRVNAVAPGAIMWPEEGKPEAEQDRLLAATALHRIGHPDDIANAVLFLLRDARYCTGQVLRVDGGRF